TSHDSRLTSHDSRLTSHDSRLTIHDSRLTIHDSRLNTQHSTLTQPKTNQVGSKNKLKRSRENETSGNVIQPTREQLVNREFDLKGHWNQKCFKNDHPLVLELGCGKGEYSIALAKRYPHKNFIGIDIKGARFWRGAKTAVEEGIGNVM